MIESVLPRKLIWKTENLGAGYGVNDNKISGVNLEIFEGERVALLGTERCGRDMLLKVLGGLRPFREGKFSALGKDLVVPPWFQDWDRLFPKEVRKTIGVALEKEGLLANVTVREGFELLFRFKYMDTGPDVDKQSKERAQKLAEEFNLVGAIDKRPFLLAAAERRICALARAFLSDPKVLLLENPSQDIGDLSRPRLWHVLEKVVEKADRTLVISTDDWGIAHHFCGRWIVMEEGKVIFDGVPEDFVKTKHSLISDYHKVLRLRVYERAGLIA